MSEDTSKEQQSDFEITEVEDENLEDVAGGLYIAPGDGGCEGCDGCGTCNS